MKKGLKPFPKGVSGNPGGRPKVPEELKVARALTAEQFTELADLILKENLPELSKIAASSTESVLKAYVAKILVNGLRKGDYTALEWVLNRVIGKVADKREVTGKLTLEDLVSDDSSPKQD